jgi:uncharacterized protein
MNLQKAFVASLGVFIFNLPTCQAQTYAESIAEFRATYKADFLKEHNGPLQESDLKYLRFYKADDSYRVVAQIVKLSSADTLVMLTKSNKEKKYVKFAALHFTVRKKSCTLYAYRSVALMATEQYADNVFVPFTDRTNYNCSYGGGRYLDFKVADFNGAGIVLDFNRSYNPYCAYASGYSCPIPPSENNLKVYIKAGEQLYAKPHAD